MKIAIKETFLKKDVEYPKNLHKLHSDLQFLREIMKTHKCSKLTCTVQERKLRYPHKCFKVSIKS